MTTAVSLSPPSRYSSDHSRSDAEKLASNLASAYGPSSMRSNGTCSASNDRTSRNNTCASTQHNDAVWSNNPVGAPTKSFSARCTHRATRGRSSTDRFANPNNANATAHSNACDDDNPAPAGTSPAITRFAPPVTPSPRNTHATPDGYAAQPPTAPGSRSATATGEACCTVPSSPTVVTRGEASGTTDSTVSVATP